MIIYGLEGKKEKFYRTIKLNPIAGESVAYGNVSKI